MDIMKALSFILWCVWMAVALRARENIWWRENAMWWPGRDVDHLKKKEGGLGGVAMCKRIFESKENDLSQNIHQLKFKTHTQKKEKSWNGSNMCWLWMKRLLCCSSHILYAHAKGGLQYRAAATDSLGRNIYATALCETQPQFFPRFLESADSWWVITAKV